MRDKDTITTSSTSFPSYWVGQTIAFHDSSGAETTAIVKKVTSETTLTFFTLSQWRWLRWIQERIYPKWARVRVAVLRGITRLTNR